MLLIDIIENQLDILPIALSAHKVHISIVIFFVSTCLQKVGHVGQVRVEQTLLRLWHAIAALLTKQLVLSAKEVNFRDKKAVEKRERERKKKKRCYPSDEDELVEFGVGVDDARKGVLNLSVHEFVF